MNVRNEIDKYASEADKPILHWLFDIYHIESQWHFVARCTFLRYGTQSYETHRIWQPRPDGYALHAVRAMYSALLECEVLVSEYPTVKRMVVEALSLAKTPKELA